MRVAVYEAHGKEHVGKGVHKGVGHVRRVKPHRGNALLVVYLCSTVNELHRYDPPVRQLPVHLRHDHLEARGQTRGEEPLRPRAVERLLREVELRAHRLFKLGDDPRVLERLPLQPPHEPRHESHRPQVPLHLRPQPRVLHLYRHHLPRRPQRRPVHLRQRRRRHGLRVEGREHLLQRPPQGPPQRPPHGRDRPRLGIVLQRPQRVRVHLRQRPVDGAHELAELLVQPAVLAAQPEQSPRRPPIKLRPRAPVLRRAAHQTPVCGAPAVGVPLAPQPEPPVLRPRPRAPPRRDTEAPKRLRRRHRPPRVRRVGVRRGAGGRGEVRGRGRRRQRERAEPEETHVGNLRRGTKASKDNAKPCGKPFSQFPPQACGISTHTEHQTPTPTTTKQWTRSSNHRRRSPRATARRCRSLRRRKKTKAGPRGTRSPSLDR